MNFDVKGMTCGHCVRAVTKAIQAQDAAAQVDVNLATGRVSVETEQSAETVVDAIRSEGYEAWPAD
ncbi:heavy-metal-associated domain-containing protein [Pseudomonas sp. Marseille-QA0892]